MSPESQENHYIVCGMGHVGYRIVLLLRRLGLPVAVIYDRAPEEWLYQAQTLGAACIQGDARSDQLLLKAGIAKARGIIAATDQDMVNLSVALDSQRLNPAIAPVVRLFDVGLAAHIQDTLNARGILSTSALAAPVFAAAALGQEDIGSFPFGGRHYALHAQQTPVTDNPSEDIALFRVREGVIAPATGQDESNACPEHLILRAVQPECQTKACHRRRKWAGFFRRAGDVCHAVPLGVRLLLGLLCAILISGVFMVHFTMGLSPIDSVYFVVTTITTTGYGDVSFMNAPAMTKLFGCFLMFSGASLLALLFGIITDAVVSHRFQGVIATGPIELTGHVIVAGAGHVGYRIVEELAGSGVPVAYICPDDKHIAGLRELNVPVLVGDARMETVLRRANAPEAMALIAADDDDVINLGVGLGAKKLNPAIRTVVRVFDGALAEKLQRRLGADRVLSVSAVAASSFVAAGLFEDVLLATVWRDHLLAIAAGAPEAAPEPAEAIRMRYVEGNAEFTAALYRLQEI